MLALEAYPSATRVGKVAVVGQETALRLLNEYVSPGEEVLIYPYCPTCYFLSATTNPTRYSTLVHNFNTPSQFQDVVGALDQRRVKYVVWDTTLQSRVLQEVFPGSQPKSPDDLILECYLESHYKLVEDDHGIRIMERK
jgi:hypothetical protein